MASDLDPAAHNRLAWDLRVDADNEWTRPVSGDVIARARTGDWSVVLIGYEPVDQSWFPADLAGVDILCLASGAAGRVRQPGHVRLRRRGAGLAW